jgi:hypothetical protein
VRVVSEPRRERHHVHQTGEFGHGRQRISPARHGLRCRRRDLTYREMRGLPSAGQPQRIQQFPPRADDALARRTGGESVATQPAA